MLSEEKIIRMTKLAAFEKREGKKNLNIVNYYRNDYIVKNNLCFFSGK